MAATIKDIAKKLNLSVSTVSYALNNGPKPVSQTVRDRVLQTASELDYRPNRVAKSLVTRKARCIGIVLPNLHRDVMLSPFVQRALNGIVNVAEELGQDLVLFTGSERNRPDLVANDLLDSRIDGVIFISPHAEGHVIELLSGRGFPFAVVASGMELKTLGFDADNQCGATLALEHLWSLGHRKIAHISGPSYSGDALARLSTYRTFMAEKGLDVPEEWIQPTNFLRPGGYEAASRLLTLPNRPTAIFAANDDTAVGALAFAQRIGLRVPEDLSIVGFDDTEQGERSDPPLTTVRQPIEEMGSRAMHAVVAQVNGMSVTGYQFPTTLVIRESTTCPKEDAISCKDAMPSRS